MVATAKWIALSLGVVFNAVANILIKAATRNLDRSISLDRFWTLATEPYLVAGVTSFGVALAFYAYSLTEVELSVAYPVMTSIGLIIVFLWSVTFFDEVLDWLKVTGTVLVLVGVLLLVCSGSGA